MHDAGRRIEVAWLLRAAAAEVDAGALGSRVDLNQNLNPTAIVQRQSECTVMQAAQQTLHRRLGVVLHKTHVSQHGCRADLGFELPELPLAKCIGGNLRREIGPVLLRVAGSGGCCASTLPLSPGPSPACGRGVRST